MAKQKSVVRKKKSGTHYDRNTPIALSYADEYLQNTVRFSQPTSLYGPGSAAQEYVEPFEINSVQPSGQPENSIIQPDLNKTSGQPRENYFKKETAVSDLPRPGTPGTVGLTEEELNADMVDLLKNKPVTNTEPPPEGPIQAPAEMPNVQHTPAAPPPAPAATDNDPSMSGHSIFEKIAQSMRYANAYDLGAVALEHRFSTFDKESEKAASVKNMAKQEQSKIAPITTSDFLQDLQKMPVDADQTGDNENARTMSAAADALEKERQITIQTKQGNIEVWRLKADDTLFFKSGLTIDADGAPNAYHPDNTGIDFNANAGYPAKEGQSPWGIVMGSNGEPHIQRAQDPYPGYFVSPTSLVDSAKATTDPARYVDSTSVPYIALPPQFKNQLGVRIGDFATVIHCDSGVQVHAIFADVGPKSGLGEGSVALAQALGHNPFVERNGIKRALSGISEKKLLYLVYPNSGSGQGIIPELTTINQQGARLFQEWGSAETLKKLYPECKAV